MDKFVEVLKKMGFIVGLTSESSIPVYHEGKRVMNINYSENWLELYPGPGYGHLNHVSLPSNLKNETLVDEIKHYHSEIFMDYDSNGFDYLISNNY